MAEFGWAYVAGGAITGAAGPTGSVLLKKGDKQISGSADLIFDTTSNTLKVAGDIFVTDSDADNDSSPTVTLRSIDTGHINDGATLRFDKQGPIVTNENLGEIWWYGSNAAGDTYYPGAAIVIEADSDWSDGVDHSTRIKFATTAGTGNPDEQMVLDSSGNLGIGTLSPTEKLQVVGTVSASNMTADAITIGQFTSTGNSTITGSLTVSGSLFANEFVTNVTNKNVVNISATGSTTFGDSADDTHTFTGAITGSKLNLTSLASGTATTSSYLAVDANNNIVLTSSSGGGGGTGTIGDAEDGSYTDGLYTDFVTSTPVGTAIDRFNEVLKILAPSPSPNLSRINTVNPAGITAKLSFGVGNPVTGYTASAGAAGFSAVPRTGLYGTGSSGNNIRLGIYDGTQDITGILNFQVSPVMVNGNLSYASGAFGNANEGTLKLELNGTVIHSVSLSGFAGSGNPATGSANSLTGDSGFTNVSVTASSFDGNGAEWYIFKHRTAKYKIDTNEQKVGWNYIRVIHTVGGTDYATNYVEWINDPSGAVNDLSVANQRIENIALVGSKYISGVQYNTDATANYKVDINNLYRNVYATTHETPISFTVSNSTTPPPQVVANISAGEDNTKILGVTASLDYNGNSLLNGAITANITVSHPFKNTISTTGSATTGNGFLIDNRTLSSTNLLERFHDETHRKQSGSFNSQGDVTGPGFDWNSTTHMTSGNAGHSDGLIFFNQRLYSPIDGDIPNGGNFSGIANVESGQPNYSSVSGIRTFFRKIQNDSGATKYGVKILSTKNSTTYNNSYPSTNNVRFYIKIPEVTGWMDISQNFVYGNISDGDGALISGASNDTDSGNNTHFLTFGTASVAANDYLMIKIEADESWTGYVSQLQFVMGASAETAATPQALSDIDANDSGTSAKLSFGTSNPISGYTNVSGSGTGSMSTINSNGDYTLSGDRRGVFTSKPTLDGEINDAIAADGGSDFPAKAFFNAFTGSLILEVNGSEVHSIALNTTSAINTVNGNGSRLNVGALAFSTTSDAVPDYLKPYRTGTYEVAADDQNIGWNYARLIHRTNSDATTNYVEWVVDPSGAVDNTGVSTPSLSDFGHTDVYYQSGIGYFASRPTGSFTYTGSNFYSNVYSRETDAISFGTTDNCSISNIRAVGSGLTTFDSGVSQASMPALNNSADCEITTIAVTGTVLFDNLTSISGGLGLFTDHNIGVASTLKHPFKTNRTTSTASKTSFMRYSGSIGSTTLTNNEYFNTEDYRIVSGNYDNQAAASSSVNTWNSQTAMNNGGTHDDGMVSVNGYAISPLKIGKAGDTRNNAEGSTGLQAPTGNPNYSSAGLTNSTRTFYRLFRYTGVSTVASFTMTLYGDATIVGKSGTYAGSLGANKNVFVELKVPFDPNFSGADDQSTLWGDCAKIASGGDPPHVADGAGLRTGESVGEDQSIDSNGLALSLTLGTRRIKQNQYYIVKISAHKDWAGYISRIQVAY